MSTTPSDGLSRFDKMASVVSRLVAKAWFFWACALLVLVWLPSIVVFPSVDTWQLVINTVTTIITFLLVALIQNTEYRSDQAVQKKLNAIIEAMADIMDALGQQDPSLPGDVEELRRASGLEEREGT